MAFGPCQRLLNRGRRCPRDATARVAYLVTDQTRPALVAWDACRRHAHRARACGAVHVRPEATCVDVPRRGGVPLAAPPTCNRYV
jgi:hypothetical protein